MGPLPRARADLSVDSLPPLLTSHAEHYAELVSLTNTLRSSATAFDDAKYALERWRDIASGGERWQDAREWEEMVTLELAGPSPEADSEEESAPKRRGKR